MNKRNVHYVRKWNNASDIALAKNKHKSKVFFGERGIPVPETYALIESYHDLLNQDFSQYPERFVVKPNKGSKGNGIMVVKKVLAPVETQQQFFQSGFRSWLDRLGKRYYDFVYPVLSQSDQFFKTGGVVYDEREFKYACARILNGSYSLSKKQDAILVEECLLPGEDYKVFCEWGLADVRVIVFNRIPIAAMVRVPTEASGGRANIAQGGIACGVNIATGKIDRLRKAGIVYDVDHFPEEYKHFAHYRVPFWQEVLVHSSTIQYFSGLGYMGIDWVIGDDGPVLLEVNARPGLEIQNVTGIGLDGMMSKVADLTVHTPQKGVEIATSLFTPHEQAAITKHHYLYLSQPGVVYRGSSDDKQEKDVVVTVSLTQKTATISPSLAEVIGSVKTIRLMCGSVLVHKSLHYRIDDSLVGFCVVLGTSAIQNFAIKPQHTMKHDVSFLAEDAMKGDDYTDLQLFDQKLHNVAKQFSLSKILQPVNYLEEFNRFVDAKGGYNPQFRYDFPTKKKLLSRKHDLQQLSDQYRGAQHFVSPFGHMLYDYMDELSDRIGLIEAYKKQDPDRIRMYNERLYGAFDEDRVQVAMSVLEEHDDVVSRVSSADMIAGQELQAYIRSYLDNHDLYHVKVMMDPSLAARIAVRLGSKVKVVLNPRAVFGRQAIDATLAHEVGVHVMRYIHGKASGWHILRKGTAQYLATEEGLAIHAAEAIHRSCDDAYVNRAIYQKYVLSAQGTMSFEHMYDFLRGWKHNNHKSLSQLYRAIARQKKGVKDTADESLLGWSKNKIYLDGYLAVGELDDEDQVKLRCGKLSLQYLDLL